MSSQLPEVGAEPPEMTARELKARLDAGERATVLGTRWRMAGRPSPPVARPG